MLISQGSLKKMQKLDQDNNQEVSQPIDHSRLTELNSDQQDSSSPKTVAIKFLSELTGLSIQIIQEELNLENKMLDDNNVSMDDLRKAMFQYLDSTMLRDNA